ncbi:MAG: RNA-binding protein [Coleofasciculaceae cyanobacterium RL_1_1]|nr:RNA-binding protein [Coleofasciculaceae cyanobacterium RL_1_1]
MTDTGQSGDAQARHLERGRQWLASVLQLGAIEAKIAAEMLNGEAWLTIEPVDNTDAITAALCDRQEHALDALQYLANATLNFEVEPDLQCSYTLEIGDYRKTRDAELKELVLEVVERVRSSGQSAELAGLTSAERREVHHYLSEYPDLVNHSHGQEPHRKLVVALKVEPASGESAQQPDET